MGATAVIAIGLLAATALQSEGNVPAPAHAAGGRAAQVGAAKPRVDFLGDSYTTGTVLGGIGATGYPALLSKAEGWDHRLDAVGGTGYVNKGKSEPFIARVSAIVRDHPDAVIVLGSRNDHASFATLKAAVTSVLDRLRGWLPRAKLIVIAPPWVNSMVPAPILRDTDAIGAAARSIPGVVFIDPVSEGWFAGGESKLIGADGVHPTDAGHAYMARLIEADLERLHVTIRAGG
jgi:lysophospholipase L1-like esterase